MQPICSEIWKDKYRHDDEQSPRDSNRRVANAVFANDPRRDEFMPLVIDAMDNLEFSPGGRIHASAGTGTNSTLLNCFINETIEDSMPGIMSALTKAALSMQASGGIGMDFSTLRPEGAVVKGINSVASGPLSFMEVFNTMCNTIKSGGNRRGAMIAVLADDHPDIDKFITAKLEEGRLTNFNLSVLIGDRFMEAVKNDGMWQLGFCEPPVSGEFKLETRNGKPWYVYKTLPARKIWEMITRNSYDHAEPGILFIDRINHWNNLGYCENIRTTNPCGEIPGPPNGVCDLGCINLASLVRNPFTPDAAFDFDRLSEVAALAVRFLDNVLDITPFPVPEQAAEAQAKRRIGVGIMGLGNALQMLGVRYGSSEGIKTTEGIMRALRDNVYNASIELSDERGTFPMFDRDKYLERPFIKQLPIHLQSDIETYGIRNGVLLTIAPTGTTAIYYGNVSSGLEPTFAWRYFRKVLQPDGSKKEFAVLDAGFEKYCEVHGLDAGTAPTDGLPDYMVSALELTVEEHVRMQATCQKYVDSSLSKTTNCPPEMSYEDYQNVFKLAYELGCKGCTTYRPSGVRDSVLSTTSKNEPVLVAAPKLAKRPDVLDGKTYKRKWPLSDESLYVTINDMNNKPFEIFVASRSAEYSELLSAITVLMSAVMRKGSDITFMIEDLERVRSAQGAFVDGKYVPGVVALIAGVLRRHMEKEDSAEEVSPVALPAAIGEICPKCGAPQYIRKEGCGQCLSCNYSKCG